MKPLQVDAENNLDQPAKKKRKKFNHQKIAPPTAEEINRLRETENVFHSNLFRMQIDEILSEVRIKDHTRSNLTSWIERIKNFLSNVEFDLNVSIICCS